ncbi:unnamed protein product [Protopolystoma xenopodis]|uniref:S1-like domain-containing protein n=1 Tax=Protopolystoma xenopodis TaxID=117903 RepID=A0A3S5AGN0_9PLAT|nr:unnamed protein product [Protopolystoma xenopodis]
MYKEEGQEYARVERLLGNGRLEAYCFDDVKRLCHIRGKLRKKVWINAGDIILVGLRDYQDKKADVILKYPNDEARTLKALVDDNNDIHFDENAAFITPKDEASGDDDDSGSDSDSDYMFTGRGNPNLPPRNAVAADSDSEESDEEGSSAEEGEGEISYWQKNTYGPDKHKKDKRQNQAFKTRGRK